MNQGAGWPAENSCKWQQKSNPEKHDGAAYYEPCIEGVLLDKHNKGSIKQETSSRSRWWLTGFHSEKTSKPKILICCVLWDMFNTSMTCLWRIADNQASKPDFQYLRVKKKEKKWAHQSQHEAVMCWHCAWLHGPSMVHINFISQPLRKSVKLWREVS